MILLQKGNIISIWFSHRTFINSILFTLFVLNPILFNQKGQQLQKANN